MSPNIPATYFSKQRPRFYRDERRRSNRVTTKPAKPNPSKEPVGDRKWILHGKTVSKPRQNCIPCSPECARFAPPYRFKSLKVVSGSRPLPPDPGWWRSPPKKAQCTGSFLSPNNSLVARIRASIARGGCYVAKRYIQHLRKSLGLLRTCRPHEKIPSGPDCDDIQIPNGSIPRQSHRSCLKIPY